MSREEYLKKLFGNDFDLEKHEVTKNYDNRDRVKNALEKAWEIRDFEIELYWKRATYFWVFIASIFAGFFAVLGNDKFINNTIFPFELNTILLLIAGMGVIFSLAWFLVNLGSKFWQENWEAHINLLEDEYYGKLYKTVITEDKHFPQFSVSKINLITSLFVLIVWIFIFSKLYQITPEKTILAMVVFTAFIMFYGNIFKSLWFIVKYLINFLKLIFSKDTLKKISTFLKFSIKQTNLKDYFFKEIKIGDIKIID
ncbi:MAG: hypothetical protein UR30_C0005G0012 [Candidatus Peregrinibacteria bacterium GW2011_GWC2_33_13]|nr:MAG: hypothetical protein UR30_C0005G0012 [Candidatus Peregrinibacteria bacterium GW2011_GWC2_33_13]